MAPPHTRVCGWRHITRQATFLARVLELGETRSFPKPARCDDTTVNHPNHFLLGFGAYALNGNCCRTTKKGDTAGRAGQWPGQQDRQGRAGQARGPGPWPPWPPTPKTCILWVMAARRSPYPFVWPSAGAKSAGHLQSSGTNGPRGPGGNLGLTFSGLGSRI